MNQYYLMAQLPSLEVVTENTPLPITEERFTELCERYLGKRAVKTFHELTLMPEREGERVKSPLLDAWLTGERQLRLALGKLRAAKMHKSFDAEKTAIPESLLDMAQTAVNMTDPMEAERYLYRYRMSFLESLRPADPFAEDSVYYYGLKLKLLLRMQKFNEERGRMAYQTIYDSILRGDGQEEHE